LLCFATALGLTLLACAPSPTQRSVVLPLSAQALSLLGDTLWSLPVSPADGPKLVEQLNKARARVASSPFDANAALVVARRTADLGRLREAVGLYTKAGELHPTDPRVPRYRGEILLQLRELDLAQRDFQSAAAQLLGKKAETEFIALDQGGLLSSTLQFNTYHLLGLTYYIKGDFGKAQATLVAAAKVASTGDDLAAAGLWLFFATRRLGAIEEARRLVASVSDSIQVSAREPELTLLLAFRDGISYDSLHLDLQHQFTTERDALLGYALGFALIFLRRSEEAELVFEQVLTYKDWSSLPVLAAEAELARMRGRHQKPEPERGQEQKQQQQQE
jgi:tetratricopeptide (TPR) repeat protein